MTLEAAKAILNTHRRDTARPSPSHATYADLAAFEFRMMRLRPRTFCAWSCSRFEGRAALVTFSPIAARLVAATTGCPIFSARRF
jgi:hypothetical protein